MRPSHYAAPALAGPHDVLRVLAHTQPTDQPPLYPIAGLRYVYLHPTDVEGQDAWQYDGYTWERQASHLLPTLDPLFRKVCDCLVDEAQPTGLQSGFTREAYMELHPPNRVLVQYLGDEKLVPNLETLVGAVQHLEKLKALSAAADSDKLESALVQTSLAETLRNCARVKLDCQSRLFLISDFSGYLVQVSLYPTISSSCLCKTQDCYHIRSVFLSIGIAKYIVQKEIDDDDASNRPKKRPRRLQNDEGESLRKLEI